jgi:flagellar protein FlgJ
MTPVAATSQPPLPTFDKAKQVSEQFESFFVYQLLESMSAGLKTDGPFGGGSAEKTWRSMQNEQYGKAITGKGGIGLGDAIYRQIQRMQEAAPAPATP